VLLQHFEHPDYHKDAELKLQEFEEDEQIPFRIHRDEQVSYDEDSKEFHPGNLQFPLLFHIQTDLPGLDVPLIYLSR